MKKIIFISLLAVAGLMAMLPDARSWSTDGAWNITEVTATSATIGANLAPFRVRAVYVTTNTTFDLTNWVILIDTPAVQPNTAYSSYASSQKKTPALLFPTTGTISQGNGIIKLPVGGEEGINFTTACFVYKGVASSGEALKAYVEWKK